MKRAIRVHRLDFAAVAALVILAAVTVIYILEHQPSFTLGRSYYTVKAPFQEAAAVMPGQGQAVTIAGVQVGLVGGVALQNGQAVVTMNLYKRYAPIYRNATVLLRPRTPLKDMYLSLDPGTPSAGRIPNGGSLSAASTAPDIDVDQILGSLDADTRNYLLLLLAGGSQAFAGRGAHGGTPSAATVDRLQGVFKRFAPLDQHTETFASLLAQRSANLRRAIHNLDLVTSALGGVGGQLASLIRASNTDFGAIASQDAALQSGLSALPGTLRQTDVTLGKVTGFADASGTALGRLGPFARALGPALAALRPLARDTTGPILNQLRPFSIAVAPLARTLAPAAAHLSRAAPDLSRSIGVLNTLFNTLAYKAPGSNSYLFWGSWLAHNADSLTNLQDANGPMIDGIFMANCPSLNLFEKILVTSVPSLTPLLDLLNAPDATNIKSPYCPAAIP
ncbi:MAG TPA: MlaD family protein [Solirubrobacteraceae bacterium]|nr:MlaD family protein [Solirubrobacteraceae bacterium]